MSYQNIYTPLQHIRPPEVNPGGLCWAVITAWENVLQWPQVDPLTGICSTPIVLKEGKTWYDIKLMDRGRAFTENMAVSASGPYWQQQFKGYLGGNNANHTLAAGTMPFHQFVVIFKDRDGLIRFMGDEDSGADILEDYNSGDGGTLRRRNFTFGWESVNPAPIYSGSLDDILDDVIVPPFQGQGDYNQDFNDDFLNG